MSKPVQESIPRFIHMPSPNFDCRKRRDIQAIVLHGTGTNNGIRELVRLRNPSSRASAHYLVDRDGKIYLLVVDKERAWHAGLGRWNGNVVDLDDVSIGIAVVGNGREEPPYTEAQYRGLKRLLSYLLGRYEHLGRDAVVCHWAVAVGRDDGPFNFKLQDVWAANVPEANPKPEAKVIPVAAASAAQMPLTLYAGE